MSSRREREQQELEAVWRDRFGEPPPLRTSLKLMRQVLKSCAPSAHAR